MKKIILLATITAALSGHAHAQYPPTISDALCAAHEARMLNIVLQYRKLGYPISYAEDLFNSEDDTDTRMFLKQVVRETYANLDLAREIFESGRFRAYCVKIHRGY